MEEDLKKISLFITSLASFINPLMGSSTNIILPSIGRDLKLSALTLSWIGLSFLLSSSIFLVPFGKLGDIYGRKKLFLTGSFIYGLFSFFCGISNSAFFLIFFRVVQGIGGAMFFGLTISILVSIYPENERGKVLGINSAMVYLGLSLGPFVGGFLAQILNWRSVFFLNSILTFFLFFITHYKLKGEWIGARDEKFDFFGAFLLILSFFFFQFGLSNLAKEGYILLLTGILIFIIFLNYEKRKKFPLFDLTLIFKNKLFLFSNISAFLHYSSTFAVGFFLSLYLQYVKGYLPLTSGAILILQPLVMAITSPKIGKASDKIEPSFLSSFGMFLSFLSMVIFSFLNESTSIYLILLILFLFGLGSGFFASPNTNAVMGSVEKKFYGLATGTISSMRVIGMVTSMSIATLFFNIFLEGKAIQPEYFNLFLNALKFSSFFYMTLLFFGIFTSLKRGKLHLKD